MNTIAQQIQSILLSQGKTLATAESCTGGLIAAALTSVPGASGYFQGGLIAYQDHIKVQELGVNPEDIAQHDVVSQQVVEQMVTGVCRKFHTDYAIASTGYADQGNERIVGGTIWIGFGSMTDVHSVCLHLSGTREQNTHSAVTAALTHFLELCKK